MDARAPFVEVEPLRNRARNLGIAFALVSVVGLFLDSEQFFRSYLVAWILWLSVALGGYALLLLQFVAPGAWTVILRRTLEAMSRTLPGLAVLGLPLVPAIGDLYLWADAGTVAADALLQHKQPYLNTPFFLARYALYFAVWSGGAWWISRLSRRQDDPESALHPRRLRSVAAPSLGLFVLTTSFFSFDWIMSLDPHWFSSLFGVYFLVGVGVTGLAFVVPMARYLSERQPLSQHFRRSHFHDYGKFLFAFVMLWAYIAVSQYLIIWSGNLPEEITWPLERAQGGWQHVTGILVLAEFFLPFLLLLSAGLKKDARWLSRVAIALLAVRWLDLYWMIAPTFHHHPTLHWLDASTLIAVGGLWMFLFLSELPRRPLLVAGDPVTRERFGDV